MMALEALPRNQVTLMQENLRQPLCTLISHFYQSKRLCSRLKDKRNTTNGLQEEAATYLSSLVIRNPPVPFVC
jgi:hypothetical protein